ncbi:chromate transporter [Aquabacterium sp. J223]|uniref:chromate transporter n=1 Tax=Aquabacterium sp. J223 TaxID=2898431 RepID=UPI0021ADEA73|nr:chromate transporter [Aquabacterium sp. J223]UUX97591.1 chromate transporter [Aquabacterium sp. J223]
MPTPAPEDDALPLAAPASPWALFAAFTVLALQGFGGVLVVAQHHLVERQRWLTRAQFLELLSLSQVLPGPNIVNLGLIYGDRCFGWRGALASVAGLLLAPCAVVLGLAVLYARYAELPQVSGALRGMGIVAAGLIAATAVRLGASLRGHALGTPGVVLAAAAGFGAVALLRWPLLAVLPAVGGVSVLATAWRLRRRGRP